MLLQYFSKFILYEEEAFEFLVVRVLERFFSTIEIVHDR